MPRPAGRDAETNAPIKLQHRSCVYRTIVIFLGLCRLIACGGPMRVNVSIPAMPMAVVSGGRFNSLFGGINSLFGREKFPDRLRREFALNILTSLYKSASSIARSRPNLRNSLIISLFSGNSAFDAADRPLL